ncbi:lysine-specific demethylase 7A isoform X2 [Syngnathus typhle]|uniref:lysine-specific demethylase 7A isoform X2 n=1 Tax=Syngnathus typhle TaxID=161592 RepID=UPI002A6A2032|nr:lysine-specific demethylase 7A isoform X2 [Syngnathus typhle]
MAATPLYCVCRQPYDVSRFMIECDICKDWFHGSCVHVEEHHAADIDVYHCPNCDVLHGPSLMKRRNNWHRHDYTEPDDGGRPVQAGTPVFVKELQSRTFPSCEEVVMRMRGQQVTPKYLERSGFRHPIAVTEMEGLGLKLPPPTFGVRDVEQYVGGDKVIDVIDVARQADTKMKLSQFIKYFTSPHRPKVLNLISLEFSDTKMSKLVEVPDVAQKMSWVENYWPDDSFFPKPFVQKYCLMGVKDSYTDFHIDFGGTSVWYHVLWGEKVFYLIRPTPANLALYEAWSSSPNQSEVFFGDKVDKCYKCVVSQGTTLLIPTGWIHAVLTSQDCMAFGGNFLHNLNIGMQLRCEHIEIRLEKRFFLPDAFYRSARCYEMERRLKTPDLFKFPYFEAICWYVAKNLLETLRELREDTCPPPTYLTEGVKALICALKTWLKREVTQPNSEVPDNIKPHHLIKELTKEIRHLEEDPSNGAGVKPLKSQGSVCGGSSGCPSTRTTLERLCQARQARRAARRLQEQQQRQATRTSSNLDILERHTREVLRRLEDPAFCAKVRGKLNKASTASAAAAESLEENHLRLMLVNGRIIRDMRRPTACPIKTESADNKSTDVKSDRMNRGPHADAHKIIASVERVKTELREDASGHSSSSDDDSDSDAPAQRKASPLSSSSDEDSEEEEQRQKGHTIELDPSHQKPLKRERPTSPSTEEAIQGMLSMAGLLCPAMPEKAASPPEPWWSSGPAEQRGPAPHQQGDASPMDSQGNSSEAWDNQGLTSPEHDYQYCDPDMSPPLHPSKRHAPNPPPISNQATKGKRPKKGMATAKQRLGKILKINRHSRVFV